MFLPKTPALALARGLLLAPLLVAALGADAPRRRAVEPGAAPQWVTPSVDAPRVQQRTLASRAAGTRVSYFVYTPPVYDAEKSRRFPVLYWLHGTGGGLRGVGPIANVFDSAIRRGQIPPLLVVFPNGLQTSMWVDSKDGRAPVETIVAREVIPDVDAAFRTIATREGRIVEGFSMGGYGAARLGFKFPDLFATVSVLAGGPLQREFRETPRAGPQERGLILNTVYGGDHAYFTAQSPWMLAEKHAAALRDSRIRVVVGDQDTMLANTRAFDQRLTQLGIRHEFHVVPGAEHQPMALLRGIGEDFWRFYREALAGAKR
jgi:enterochelin esterase-like enzyme